jgi:hypothetical protein
VTLVTRGIDRGHEWVYNMVPVPVMVVDSGAIRSKTKPYLKKKLDFKSWESAELLIVRAPDGRSCLPRLAVQGVSWAKER